MRTLFLVGSGGFIGSVCRYYLSAGLRQLSGAPRFPTGTLAVNLLGCLLIGAFAGWSVGRDGVSESMRLFVVTGVLGGFTTFSAFGLETQGLLRDHQYSMAATYVLLSVALGIAGVAVGFRVGAG